MKCTHPYYFVTEFIIDDAVEICSFFICSPNNVKQEMKLHRAHTKLRENICVNVVKDIFIVCTFEILTNLVINVSILTVLSSITHP